MVSKAYVHKRPPEYRKYWRPGGYKDSLVGFDEMSYSIWVPELGAAIQSSDVVVDELAQGEWRIIQSVRNKDQRHRIRSKLWKISDFKGINHIDNENGLEYRLIDIRKHRS